MNQLAIIDRGAAARKAWATRRERGWVPGSQAPTVQARKTTSAAADALSAFEAEDAKVIPDWHSVALKFKKVLVDGAPTVVIPRKPKPLALPAPRWHDYPVDRVSSFSIRTDILVVTFADGDIVRAPAVSAKGKPTNIGRGLRIAIAFYQARACWRRSIKFRAGVHAAVPAIAACICEDSGETFDAEECTVRTIDDRKAQDWRIRR
jgi:hypothetical protein